MDEFYHFNVSITDSVFTYNMATGRLVGGGVACIRNASISILRSSFQLNQAALHGGIFHIDESDVLVDESVFVNNSASEDGGVFYTYVHLSNYDIRRSEFSYNSAGDDGGVMFIGRVNSRVNISECVFSFNIASGRRGVAALIGSTMYLQLNNIFNNTAEYGGIISACNSVVMVMEDALFMTPDPVYSFCTLYDGHIVHYHISPPVDPERTPSPSTTQQTKSPFFEMISSTRPQNHSITSPMDFSTTNTISNSTSKLYPTQLSSVISVTERNEATSHSDMVISKSFSQSPIMVKPSKMNFLTTTAETVSSNSAMQSSEYLLPQATTSYTLSSLTYSTRVADTYLQLSSPPRESVNTPTPMRTEQLPTTSQSHSTQSVHTEYVVTSQTTSQPENTYSYSEGLESSLTEMTRYLVSPTHTTTSSSQQFVTVYQSTYIPPANNEGEGNKGSVNSDTDLKLYVIMAISGVSFMAILAILIVLAGMIIKLYKMKPANKQPTTSRYRRGKLYN